VQGYAFFDAARVWNSDAGVESASLASTGAGLRVTFADRLTASAELARPLTRTPAEEGDKDWRPFFSLSTSY
jgi:hemolysin activation/secretion protein